MRVAVVHYHLKPGGVTRIVESAAAALAVQGIEVVAISGEPYLGETGLKTATVPGLAYTLSGAAGGVSTTASELWHEIKAAAKAVLGEEPDLWHIHNHSLGKNMVAADLVWQMAQEAPVLLQIHDFAEDGRPANYTTISQSIEDWSHLYPYGTHVHYAVLNQRDRCFLASAGLPDECLHLLPNPVVVPSVSVGENLKVPGVDRLILYPTRAIRRKNLGELLLWAAMAEEGELYAATLAPANPTARPVYDRWVEFAQRRKLRARFELAKAVDLSFPQLMTLADVIVTTSVAEGFGMAFLEPYLFGKGLTGRDLPEITGDFARDGVLLDGLYDRLDVPLAWIGGEEALRAKLAPALENAYAAYGRACGDAALDIAVGAAVREGRVDMGRLDEALQEQAIDAMRALPNPRDDICPPVLASQDAAVVEANCDVIARHFNLEQYGRRLIGIYGRLLAGRLAVTESLDPARVLDAFLDPARFCLLRT